MKTDTADRLEQIFRAVFQLPATANVRSFAQSNTPSWDSLAHVSIVMAIENEFGLTVDASDQLRFTSFEAIAQFFDELGL